MAPAQNKIEVICYALQCCNTCDLSKAIMIGDREELEQAVADFIVDNVDEIGKIIIKLVLI